MPLDPKYANLPWIALDQPDSYETSELPEADQHTSDQHEESVDEGIENLSINAQEAKNKFAGKNLTTSNVDFSDRISKTRKTGYGIETNEYEILLEEERAQENPVQKYQRIQTEISQLVEQVGRAEAVVKETADSSITPSQLAEKSEELQRQMAEHQLDRIMGSDAKVFLSDGGSNSYRRLLQHIESFEGGKKADKKAAQSGDNKMVYELSYQPDVQKNVDQNKLTALEQRIQRVEALLGNNPAQVSALTADTANKTLLEAVNKLSARSSLLEPAHLDQIEGRLATLHHKLQTATERKDVIADADTQNKIAELYELVKKWDAVSDALPALVTRLNALDQLQNHAAQFSQALCHLDTNQQQVSNTLKSHKDMVEKLQTQLKETLTTVKTNCEAIDVRLKKLGK